MQNKTMLRIPKEISSRIGIVKALLPKIELNKEEWGARLLNEALEKYEKEIKKHRFV